MLHEGTLWIILQARYFDGEQTSLSTFLQSEQSADLIINQENHLQEHKKAAALLKQPEQEYRPHTWDTAPKEHGHAPTAQMSCCGIPWTAF